MIIISVRKDFWGNNKISNGYHIRKVTLGCSPTPDGDTPKGTKLRENDFFGEISGKRVLLLVHGYNNELEDVLRAYDIIDGKIKALTKHYDRVIGFSWPGGDDWLDYFAAKQRSGVVACHLRGWLEKIKPKVTRLDVMTHSMGTRVLLSALPLGNNLLVDNAFNMASAVDNECLEPFEKYHVAAKNCKAFYVFHSQCDGKLSLAYRLADRNQALGYSGPEDTGVILTKCPQVKVVNCKHVIKSHGGYKNADAVYKSIDAELKAKAKKAGIVLPQFVTL